MFDSFAADYCIVFSQVSGQAFIEVGVAEESISGWRKGKEIQAVYLAFEI